MSTVNLLEDNATPLKFEIEGNIQVKTKRYWVKRYGKLKNGIFMYFQRSDRITPRRVLDIKHAVIQSNKDIGVNRNIINLIFTRDGSQKNDLNSMQVLIKDDENYNEWL